MTGNRLQFEAPAEDGANYVLGFMFAASPPGGAKLFVAIEKKRPTRHIGLLNGVGGRVEAGESALDAMIREAREETGIEARTWSQFAKVVYSQATMFCFMTFVWEQPKQMTDEHVQWVSVPDVVREPRRFVSSVPWLLMMALEQRASPTYVDRRGIS